MASVYHLPAPRPGSPQIVFGRAVLRRLLEKASELTAIPTHELLGRSRPRDTAWTRFAIMLVASEKGRSQGQIATFFAHADHTGVLHGIRRARELGAKEPEFAELVRLLREEASR